MKKKMFVVLFILAVLCCQFQMIAGEDDGVTIFNRVSQSVARIVVGDGWGTGFFITDRYIVTNHHVVSNYITGSTVGGTGWFTSAKGDTVRVYYSEANRDYTTGKVVQDWPEVDLAVVEITPDSRRIPISLVSPDGVNVGMNVFIVGYPGVDTTDTASKDIPSFSRGVLKKIYTDWIRTSDKYQAQSYDALINPGNSGGPVVGSDGNVIGIANSSRRTSSETGYFGIHVSELISRLDAAGIPYTIASGNAGSPTPLPTSSGTNPTALPTNPAATATPLPATSVPGGPATATPFMPGQDTQPTAVEPVSPQPTAADPIVPQPTAAEPVSPQPTVAEPVTPTATATTESEKDEDDGLFSGWETKDYVIAGIAAAALIIVIILVIMKVNGDQSGSGSGNIEISSGHTGYSRNVSGSTTPYNRTPYQDRKPVSRGYVDEPTLPKVEKGAWVEGVSGQLAGMRKHLSHSSDCIFGKDPSVCTVVFDSSAKMVSRKHCEIHYSNTHQRFIILDLGSTNGTILMRGPDHRQVPTNTGLGLKDGDQILIPDRENVFRVHIPAVNK